MMGISLTMLLLRLHVREGFIWAIVVLSGIANAWILVRWHLELKRLEKALNAYMLRLKGEGSRPE
jgi:hypothetical protein